jgi:protein involved in polysaccharide export with SLBB domain
MTVLQALAMAEGLGSTAAADRAVIVRDGPNQERIEIPVDLRKVLEGSEPAPQMAARDVLFVPNNSMKAFGLGVVNALVSMVTLRGLVY